MKPFVVLIALFAALIGAATVAPTAGAQTPDLTAFCNKLIEVNNSGGKAQLKLIDELVPIAPATLVQPITEVRDAFKKYGSDKGYGKVVDQITAVDSFSYDSCPGNKVAVTAIDYEFQGVPTTLPAGINKFRLTNTAPKEAHEFGFAKLTAAGAALDPEKLLSLPDKKVEKYVDVEHSSGTYAEPGTSGYTMANLEPGTYIYACFLPVGGKKSGAPHFTKGMYGTFTVS